LHFADHAAYGCLAAALALGVASTNRELPQKKKTAFVADIGSDPENKVLVL
jgi:hypothetical protein